MSSTYALIIFAIHFKSMFEGVTCGNSITSNEIITGLHVKKMYDICPSATELHNVTTSEDEDYMRYCGSSLFVFLII